MFHPSRGRDKPPAKGCDYLEWARPNDNRCNWTDLDIEKRVTEIHRDVGPWCAAKRFHLFRWTDWKTVDSNRVKLLNSKSITERSPYPFPDVISNCNYFISDLKLNTNLPWNANGAIDFSWMLAKFKNWRVTSVKLKVSVSMAEMLLKSRLMPVSKRK